jgi:hypothetical protein
MLNANAKPRHPSQLASKAAAARQDPQRARQFQGGRPVVCRYCRFRSSRVIHRAVFTVLVAEYAHGACSDRSLSRTVLAGLSLADSVPRLPRHLWGQCGQYPQVC